MSRWIGSTALIGVALGAGVLPAEPPGGQPPPVIPSGKVISHTFKDSKIFPGTVRNYQVYVPQQYDPAKPACVYVCQDGIGFGNTPTVFDRFIYEKVMPVTVGVFVMPGRIPDPASPSGYRENRAVEYHTQNDDYVRFLLDELLPQIAKEDKLNLSTNANDRAIAGISSGGMCAILAAWERPDVFRRVYSCCGALGATGPTLIQLCEPKPIRIFLEDGSADFNWSSNLAIEYALASSGYEVAHAWSDGPHGGGHGNEVFADAMRWLWKDWPAPPKVGPGPTAGIVIPGEPWKPVAQGYSCVGGLAANDRGEVFFSDAPSNKTYKIGRTGKVSLFLADPNGGSGLAFAPDGRLYTLAGGSGRIVAYDKRGRATTVADGIRGRALVARHDGGLYVSSPGSNEMAGSQVWFIGTTGEPKPVSTGLTYAASMAMSCDQSLLYATDNRAHWVYRHRIQSDGSLSRSERFYPLYAPTIYSLDTNNILSNAFADGSGADGICVDRDDRLYVATPMGVQVCNRPGVVTCIVSPPDRRMITGLCFGGARFDTLFAACGGQIFQRKMAVSGACVFQP